MVDKEKKGNNEDGRGKKEKKTGCQKRKGKKERRKRRIEKEEFESEGTIRC